MNKENNRNNEKTGLKYPEIICISGKAQNGKDTSANYLKEIFESIPNRERVLITHYGDLVKYICATFFEWDGKKDEAGRTLLQYVGTDIIRKRIPSYWVRFIIEQIDFFHEHWDIVLIPDCRFPNEIEAWKSAGYSVTSVKVKRPNFKSPLTEEQQKHVSETALDDYETDYVLMNDKTKEDLKKECNNFVEYFYNKLEG